ncbi:MAG: helix-turn-helix domain-containing protein [Eubacteriaceae bacterium]|jgi:transcriptional regulator with XRE-family HTH domain|nr:helix-turn-helix domain-containing protein [Eubacteriaceae bacterium]
MGFPERLKELRSNRKLTQGEVADSLHIPQSSIAAWESGRTNPRMESILAIANLFNVSFDYLMGLSDVEERINESTASIENISMLTGLTEAAVEKLEANTQNGFFLSSIIVNANFDRFMQAFIKALTPRAIENTDSAGLGSDEKIEALLSEAAENSMTKALEYLKTACYEVNDKLGVYKY